MRRVKGRVVWLFLERVVCLSPNYPENGASAPEGPGRRWKRLYW